MLVEMHAHVIYGVDDGPQTPDAMYQMLYSAQANGVERLYCTSHYTLWNNSFPLDAYRSHLEEAREWCERNAPHLTLYSGAEIYVDPSILALPLPENLPVMQGTDLVLLEFPFGISARDVVRAVEKFQAGGFQPILAHVERYSSLRSAETVQKLKNECGAKIQINAQSVFDASAGFFQKRRIKKLLQMGLIDFVSSDAHNTTSRAFCLEYARHWLNANGFADIADALCGENIRQCAASAPR